MNRSTVYDYLKTVENMRPLFYKHGRGYHVEFVPTVWTRYTEIQINKGFIHDFYSIVLLIQEIVIKGEGSMEIHIPYSSLEEFHVYVEGVDD